MDATKLLQIATAEIGYREDPPGTNKNKFAADLDANYPGWYYYNGGPHKKNSFDWCTIFHDWCFIKAYGETEARKLLYRPKLENYGAGVKYSYNYYKGVGRTGTTPKVGCSVYFTSYKDRRYPTHIGICSGVTASSVTVIEGNAGTNSEYVIEKTYDRKNNYIYGYGYPEFDAMPVSDYTPGSIYQVTCSEPLNIREAAGKSARIISEAVKGKLIRCEGVEVDAAGNTWLKISAYMCAVEDGHKYIE